MAENLMASIQFSNLGWYESREELITGEFRNSAVDVADLLNNSKKLCHLNFLEFVEFLVRCSIFYQSDPKLRLYQKANELLKQLWQSHSI